MSDPAARFARLTQRGAPDECWPWQGYIDKKGYGRFRLRSIGTNMAHRAAVVLAGRTIPDGMQVDHLCRVRHCVNPNHLEVVDQRTNMVRGEHPLMVRHRENRCARGHDLAEAYPGRNGRQCRKCATQKARERRAQS
jgi:hypothetical protein